MDLQVEIAIFALLGIIILVVMFWIVKTETRLKRFFVGKKAKDLEDTIFHLQEEITVLKSAKEKIEKELVTINAKLKKSIRGLETIRFNPFPDQGGNQSFAVGMLNEEGNGVVISSLYARDRMSVFAKPVKGGRAEYDLTQEEQEALAKAKVSA